MPFRKHVHDYLTTYLTIYLTVELKFSYISILCIQDWTYWRVKQRKNSDFSSYGCSTGWASLVLAITKMSAAFFAKCSMTTRQKKITSDPWFETSTAFWSRRVFQTIFVYDWFFIIIGRIRIRIFLILGTVLFLVLPVTIFGIALFLSFLFLFSLGLFAGCFRYFKVLKHFLYVVSLVFCHRDICNMSLFSSHFGISSVLQIHQS